MQDLALLYWIWLKVGDRRVRSDLEEPTEDLPNDRVAPTRAFLG